MKIYFGLIIKIIVIEIFTEIIITFINDISDGHKFFETNIFGN